MMRLFPIVAVFLALTAGQAQAGWYGWHPHLTPTQGYLAVVVGLLAFFVVSSLFCPRRDGTARPRWWRSIDVGLSPSAGGSRDEMLMRRVRRRPASYDLPRPNPMRPGRDREKRLREIQRRFRAVSARHNRAISLRRYRSGAIAALAATVAFAVVWGLSSSPWPAMTMLRHFASFPNCAFARAVGLAPAKEGQPGYWKRHDRDRDGTACEPRPRRYKDKYAAV
jgi:Excalibur calcium-binding domain